MSNDLWLFDVPSAVWREVSPSGLWPPYLGPHGMVTLNETTVLLFQPDEDMWPRGDRLFFQPDEDEDEDMWPRGGSDFLQWASSCLWFLDVPSEVWRQICPQPVQTRISRGVRAVTRFAVTLNENRVLRLEGDELWCLDVPDASWTLLPQEATRIWGAAMVTLGDSSVLVFGGEFQETSVGNEYVISVQEFSNELWLVESLDLVAERAVRWTRLRDVNVTEDELLKHFNNKQVHTALPHSNTCEGLRDCCV